MDANIPWRLRFDGLAFDRLDSSAQSLSHDASSTNAYWFREARGFEWLRAETPARGLLGRLRRPFGRLRRGLFEEERSYRTLATRETIRFRLQAVESFHRNRPQRIEPASRFDFMSFGRVALGVFRRWTGQSNWKRRELMPPFTPQPLDQFARAYAARGDLEAAEAITMRRMGLHWRKRTRVLVKAWWGWMRPLVLVGWAAWLFGYQTADGPVANILFNLLVAATAVPLAALGLLALFRLCFGYGLKTRRSLLSAAAFYVGVSLFAGTIVSAVLPQAARSQPGCRDLARSIVKPGDLYALDKLVPADLGSVEPLRARIATRQTEAAEALRTARIDYDREVAFRRLGPPMLAGAKPEAELRQAIDRASCVDAVRRRFETVNGFFDFAGWLILLIVGLALTGFLRRDLERR